MKKIIILMILAIGFFHKVKAQEVLPLMTDARSSAMGGVGTLSEANAFSIYNYAGIIALDDNKWAAGYSFGGIMPSKDMHSLHTVAGYWKLSAKHCFMGGMRYYSYPSITEADEYGALKGNFVPFDMVVDLGYAYLLNKHLSVSATVRYIAGKMSDQAGAKAASALGMDVGLTCRYKQISAGFMLSNLGTKINYGGDDYDMPARVKAAGNYAFQLNKGHLINATAEVAYAFLPDAYTGAEAGIGAEYVYHHFISVRMGYRFGNSDNDPKNIDPNNLGSSLSYATVGAGIHVHNYSLDFSFIPASSDSPMKNTFKISFGTKF